MALRRQFPDVFLMGRQHGNRERAPVALALWNSTNAQAPAPSFEAGEMSDPILKSNVTHHLAKAEVQSLPLA
jgi:hypothetical protein